MTNWQIDKTTNQQEAIAEEDWDKIGAEEHKDNDMQQMSVKEEHHDIMIVQPQHEFEAEAENDMDDAEVEMWQQQDLSWQMDMQRRPRPMTWMC